MTTNWRAIRKFYERGSRPLTRWYTLGRYSFRLEFKWQDLWLGMFVAMSGMTIQVWLCIVPMVPIHVVRDLPEEARR